MLIKAGISFGFRLMLRACLHQVFGSCLAVDLALQGYHCGDAGRCGFFLYIFIDTARKYRSLGLSS